MQKYGNQVKKPASHHRGGSKKLLAKIKAAVSGKTSESPVSDR
jgi:hypothetical protein